MSDEFTQLLIEFSRHFGVLERDQICCGDVTVVQCAALNRLRQAPTGVSDLANYLGNSVSATTRLVQGLERRGWVGRRPDPDDGRRVHLELTDDGQAIANELRQSTENLTELLLARIPAAKQEAVADALATLRDALADCRVTCCDVPRQAIDCGD